MSQAPQRANQPPRERQRQRAIDVGLEEATIEVWRAVYGVETETRTKVRVSRFEGETGMVEVEGSRTINTGDYNSARVGVRVRLPCYPEESEITRAYNIASEMVERFMENEIRLAVPTRGGSNG